MSNNFVLLASRIMMVLLFLVSGAGMASMPSGIAGYFSSLGIPAAGLVVWLVVILKIVAGLAIVFGFQTRYAAYAFAAFCVVAALIGHNNFADQNEMTQFLKDISIAGGFLALSVAGPGGLSIDARRG
ncbi:MAG TPA: DoxX family protein [Rhizobiales bacterium]|nr:DoxX family protein [Hyphomicrobiales bacterium]